MKGVPPGDRDPQAVDVNPMEPVRLQSVRVEQVRPCRASRFGAQADRREDECPGGIYPERPRCSTKGHPECRAPAAMAGGTWAGTGEEPSPASAGSVAPKRGPDQAPWSAPSQPL